MATQSNSATVEYRSFEAGNTIIEQGEDSTDVFTLVEGRAIAVQSGKKVGEIQSGEIFGAIAAFTNSKRQASVVATQDCIVQSVPQAEFMKLLEAQPELANSIK